MNEFQVTPLNSRILNQNTNMPQKKALFNFNPNLKMVFLGAFIIVAIGVLFFFLGRTSFSEGKIDLNIEGPAEIVGGDLVKYKIAYKNNSKVDLSEIQLVFTYPEDAVGIQNGEVVDLNNEIINIGRLNKGESGELEREAYIVGNSGNIKQAKAAMTFTARGIQSVIKKDAVLSTTITSLPVFLTLVAPPTAIDGQEITYILDYRNQSGGDLDGFRANIKLPDSFSFIRSTPSPDSGRDTWDIKPLDDGEGGRITITGIIRGSEREAKQVSVTLQRKIETDKGEQYLDFEKASTSTAISSPLLSVVTQVNGSRDYAAGLGDTLNYTIDFRNDTRYDLLGLTLSAKLEGVMFDFASIDTDGFFDGRQNTIFWNASSIPALGSFGANQTGRAQFKVKLKQEFPGGIFGTRNSLVKVTAALSTSNVPSELGLNEIITQDELVTRISTDTTFNQSLFVNDPVWGSVGPFPPKVDRETAFTVKWELINPANLVAPARITAILAPGVAWKGQARVGAGSGQPSFNPNTSEVAWDIGSLPAGVGSTFPPYESYFLISITPSSNQVGQAVDLLRNIKFTGTDTFTGREITKTLRDLTTDQTQDRSGGRVEQ